MDSLLFTLPISFRMTRNRSFSDDADQNGAWSYNITLLPELDWSLTASQTVGAAYVTDNMIYTDGSELVLEPAFKNGTFQVLWNWKF